MDTRRPRSVLVLGAGGPVGLAFHAGTLAGLQEAGWDARDADVIVGTSAGALTAALLRAGVAPLELADVVAGGAPAGRAAALLAAAELIPTGDRRDRPVTRGRHHGLWRQLLAHPRRIRPSLLLTALVPQGTVPADPIAEAIDRILPAWPARRLVVCAVDARTGSPAAFDGAPASVGRAVAASCAVPGWFAPVAVGGGRYIDGGTHAPAATGLAAGEAPTEVVASVPMGLSGWPGRLGVDVPGRWLNHLRVRAGLSAAAAAGAAVRCFEPGAGSLTVMGYDAFATGRLAEIAERARDAVIAGAGRLAGGGPAELAG